MRFLASFLFVLTTLFSDASHFPSLTGRVVDDANLLKQETKNELITLLENEEANSSNQVVVVTLKSLDGYTIDEYSIDLARHWKIGQKGKDNGVLLVIAPNERKTRIEVGYGLEGVLTDKISHEIITYTLIPAFKKGDFNGGVLKATKKIISAINGEFEKDISQKSSDGFAVLISFFIGFGMLMVGGISNSEGIKKAGLSLFVSSFSFPITYSLFSPSIYPSLIIILLLAISMFFLLKNKKLATNPKKISNTTIDNSYIGGGIFGGSGGFGGGGFSGGGGSFGGGGASGGW